MRCDHNGVHSGGSRYLRETGVLRLVLVCDQCGEDRRELTRYPYQPHGRRFVGHLTELTARELGLPDAHIARVRLAAMVCDVGRDQIPAHILSKRGPLRPAEWVELRRQPELGAALLADTSFDDIRQWILCHRERPDGRGYPRALSGKQIPVEARILAVTDAYVAMITDRPYRLARTHEQAITELLRCAGTQFDASVVEAFARSSERRNPQLALIAS